MCMSSIQWYKSWRLEGLGVCKSNHPKNQCQSKRTKSQSVVNIFNTIITNQTSKRYYINPFQTKVPPGWETVMKNSPNENVDLLREESIPSCFIVAVREGAMGKKTISIHTTSNRARPFQSPPIVPTVADRAIFVQGKAKKMKELLLKRRIPDPSLSSKFH
ncbi:hypothetical protein Tco_1078038 [Tanacetum coccineum]